MKCLSPTCRPTRRCDMCRVRLEAAARVAQMEQEERLRLRLAKFTRSIDSVRQPSWSVEQRGTECNPQGAGWGVAEMDLS